VRLLNVFLTLRAARYNKYCLARCAAAAAALIFWTCRAPCGAAAARRASVDAPRGDFWHDARRRHRRGPRPAAARRAIFWARRAARHLFGRAALEPSGPARGARQRRAARRRCCCCCCAARRRREAPRRGAVPGGRPPPCLSLFLLLRPPRQGDDGGMQRVDKNMRRSSESRGGGSGLNNFKFEFDSGSGGRWRGTFAGACFSRAGPSAAARP